MELISNHSSVISSEESFLVSIFQSSWRNRCISVIVGLKIPDIICSSQETSLSIDEIATKAGCDSTKQLYPMMRLAARWGIGKEVENKHFTKNKTLELLRRDQGPSLGHVAEYLIGDELYTGMRSLAACVKHGTPSFVLEHGMTHTQYMSDIANCPYNPDKMYEGASKYKIGSDERRHELFDIYEKSMKYICIMRRPLIDKVLEAFPWSESKKIVDVGGSTGDFLASILNLPGCDNIQGYVLELPEVVDDAIKKIDGIGAVGQRLQFIRQDCFHQAFPKHLRLNADTVIVKHVLSLFTNDEEKITTFFGNCRDLFPADGGRMLAIDNSVPDSDESHIGINGLELESCTIHWLNISGVHLLTQNEWVEVFKRTGGKMGYNLHKIFNTFDGGVIFELHFVKPQ